jgi:hypothetical protein
MIIRITCQLPFNGGDQQSVGVKLCVSSQCSNELYFSYQPVIHRFHIPSAPTTGQSLLTVYGSSFTATPTLSVGGHPCSIALGNSNGTIIICMLPIGQGINQSLIVTVDHLSTSGVPSLSYDPPRINSVFPTSGTVDGGYVITIGGINFGIKGDQTSVTIDDLKCNIKWSNHTIIYCIIPPHQTGNAIIKVTTSAQSNNDQSSVFTYFERHEPVRPVIFAGTLRLYGDPRSGHGVGVDVTIPNTAATDIEFEGTNLYLEDGSSFSSDNSSSSSSRSSGSGGEDELIITYGSSNEWKCDISFDLSSSNHIVCTTQPFSTGKHTQYHIISYYTIPHHTY